MKKLLLVGLVALGLGLVACSPSSNPNTISMNNFSTDTYKSQWDEVKAFEEKSLPKSALEIVEKIYEQSKKDNNPAQLVKAIIHKEKYQSYEEDAFARSIENIQKELEKAKFPVKPLLHSMLAEMYFQYYQQNRYRFNDRTYLEGGNSSDIRTWDARQFVKEIIANYQASLENPDQLKQININIYEEILNNPEKIKIAEQNTESDASRKLIAPVPPTDNGKEVEAMIKNARNLRPSLYDFLGHRAIDFYMVEDPDIIIPAGQFLLNEEKYFEVAEDFTNLKIETAEQLSYKYQALLLFQDLMRFHLHDQNPEAFVDVDLKRLDFIHKNSTAEKKEEWYLGALQNLKEKYKDSPLFAQITFEHAQHLYNQGYYSFQPGLYEQENRKKQFKAKEVFDLCKEAIDRFPTSNGAQNCKNLQAQIQAKELSIMIEKVNTPNQAFRTFVEYRNLQKLYFRIVKIDRNQVQKIQQENEKDYDKVREEIIKFYAKQEPKEKFSIELPNDNGYQRHSLEAKIPALPLGEYIILAGTSENMSYEKEAVSYSFTSISNISYIHRTNKDQSMDVYVLDRQSGQPLAEAAVQIWVSEYNYSTSQNNNEVKTAEKYTTDKEGFFRIPAPGDYRNFSMQINYKDDEFFTSDPTDQYSQLGQGRPYDTEPEMRLQTFFFLDRAIYRPGQTIYFKGILLNTDGQKKHEIKANTPVTITFYDVNHQKVSDLKLITNDYGSFNGSFIAPSTGLNGQMSISHSEGPDGYYDTHGTAYFSVEDYKRPKFEVTFEEIKGTYRLNDQIKIKGTAKAYSGANIDSAEVKYHVVRTAQFPFWWFCFWGYYPPSPSMEIAEGVAKTNGIGEFEIEFTAIPDLTVPADSKPTFNYQIITDVTDLNGETRSGSENVKVGYNALFVNVEMPDAIDKNKEQTFEIKTTNLSDEFEAAQGSITIHKLKDPGKVFRDRLWPRPDTFIMTKEEFYKEFPHDLYDDENNFFKWEKEQEVLNLPFDTAKEKELKLSTISDWRPGKYMLEITSKDKYGEEVKEVSYFTVYDGAFFIRAHSDAYKPPYSTNDWFFMIKNQGEPGESAKAFVGSSEKTKALFEIEHDGKIITKEWQELGNRQHSLDIPLKEEYRGNIALHYTFIKNNRLYTHDEIITVPYTNKELDIIFETFRNKLEPGQKEEWKLRLKGKNGDKVAAEMVAALYDASLDTFRPHNWFFNIYNNYYSSLHWDSRRGFEASTANLYAKDWNEQISAVIMSYDELNWFDFIQPIYSLYRFQGEDFASTTPIPPIYQGLMTGGGGMMDGSFATTEAATGYAFNKEDAPQAISNSINTFKLNEANKESPANATTRQSSGTSVGGVQTRTNFNETAFFYPDLKTNDNGEIIISFTIPEALTRWKMLGFAHTKDLKYGLKENELVTQKDLMVVTNPPRFFREGDTLSFTAKITNISDQDLKGQAQIELLDALTMQPLQTKIDENYKLSGGSIALDTHGKRLPQEIVILKSPESQNFETKKGQSTIVTWNLAIPDNIEAITYRVKAKAGNFSDGEEMTIPVLTNRMLVTETLPLPIRGNQSKEFKLEKLLNNNSSTLRNHKLTLEYTSNPAWYAVQALPYLMEYPYECAEQVFSRFYANSLATHIANADPKIKQVFDQWKNSSSDALLSNLEKNQELKSLLLEETPWVREAQNEAEQKRRIALLFDLNHMSNELDQALNTLIQMQVSSGGWPWFKGMPEDRYITQHIVTGMGHLQHLGVKNIMEDAKVKAMTVKAIGFLDAQIQKDYEELKRQADKGEIKLEENHLGSLQIQYLYSRSFFPNLPVPEKNKEAVKYFMGQAQKYWTKNNIYMQGMIALALYRTEDEKTAQAILKSLKEKAVTSEESGMYWSDVKPSYFWYQAPVETQALMIELFDEAGKNPKDVEDLKVWLLKQKQTQNWHTTKATSEAIYALLLKGTNLLASDTLVEIIVGSQKIDPKQMDDVKVEAGTGYFKTSWSGSEIKKDMGNIKVTKKDDGIAWGALYWQYFENLDQITSAATPLQLKKQLFLKENTAAGTTITPIDENTKLKPGDRITVRIELRVDRDMEYVHMKDMRASAFEPLNVLSGYKYQDGLGYYESTRDAATNFFFNYLGKGTYVFEYDLRVTHEGDFSNGITTIQSMYAPEFASHSEGIRVKVGE